MGIFKHIFVYNDNHTFVFSFYATKFFMFDILLSATALFVRPEYRPQGILPIKG